MYKGAFVGPGSAHSLRSARRNLALSVVVPTRNEAGNVDELIGRLANALSHVDAELIFVDDSDDDTAARVTDIAQRSNASLPIRVIHRAARETTGGLGSAV